MRALLDLSLLLLIYFVAFWVVLRKEVKNGPGGQDWGGD